MQQLLFETLETPQAAADWQISRHH